MSTSVDVDVDVAVDAGVDAGAATSRSALSAGALARLAGRLGARTDLPTPSGDDRRWVRLARTGRYEAWLIVWPPGTGLALHDHAGSAAGVAMVSGRLRERFGRGPSLHTRWWSAGDTFALEADHAHEVFSLDGADAVSIHVYSPPLGDVHFRTEQARTLTDLPPS